MSSIVEQIHETLLSFDIWGLLGLVFGLLAVWFLIKESIWTWPFGILYVLVSFVVFWDARLYGDLLLHVFFLILNIYGWYYWLFGKDGNDHEVVITTSTNKLLIVTFLISLLGIGIFGYFLEHLPNYFEDLPASSLPYWDATTSILSVTGMWLTTKKKIENWYYWLLVDILATGIYFYKGVYFFAILYLVYIGMAVSGYLTWKKLMNNYKVATS